MPENIEFTPLATSDPLDDEQPITTSTSTTTRRPNPHSPKHNSLAAQIERLGDMAISGLGPVLISLAFLLLSVTIFCFYSVFLPFHHPWNEGEGIFGNLAYIFHWIWATYLVWGILANYYLAVRTPAGSVLDGVSSSVNKPNNGNRKRAERIWSCIGSNWKARNANTNGICCALAFVG